MHQSVLDFVGKIVADLGIADNRVLEVGSFNVNGSVRQFFGNYYLGCDVRPGPGVDEVVMPGKLPYGDGAFDVVVSTEMLEHDRRPWRTVAEMHRVLRPGGLVIITARGYDERGCFVIHEPPDIWRYSLAAMDELLSDAGFEQLDVIADPEAPGVFAIGFHQ